mgnify:CR=1 FL=1|tara:strand:- start:672 stop:857 length:186 start_codon:yes stop_codon:yes gene_type:complete
MFDDLTDPTTLAAESNGMLSRQSIYRMIEKGFIPAIRKGRKIFIRRSEVEAAFKSDNNQAA